MTLLDGVLIQKNLLKHRGCAFSWNIYCMQNTFHLLNGTWVPLQRHFHKVNTLPLS